MALSVHRAGVPPASDRICGATWHCHPVTPVGTRAGAVVTCLAANMRVLVVPFAEGAGQMFPEL